MIGSRRIDSMFDRMLSIGASDLHLHQEKPAKARVHGTMRILPEFGPMSAVEMQTLMRELCGNRWEEFENGHDLDFACEYGTRARFRANFKKHYGGYGAVFRVIPSKILTLDELKAPPILREFAEYKSGLCLVTGPTGSGKSTTLAAVIDHINSTRRSTILTIEEPVEFVHSSRESIIIQREVGTDVKSFGDGLKGALRQDLEVVLVGEMRDLETIRLAVTAAETGLLVFGTLHTNNAIKTIDRIIDVFPPEEQGAVRESLATSLRAVCAQQLLPTADNKGRIAVHEILIQNRAVSNLIREAKTNQIVQAMMSGKAQGMQLLDDVLEGLVKSRSITAEQALMKATDKERFQIMAGRSAS